MCSLELNGESSEYTKNKSSPVIILLFTRSTQQRRWWQKLQLSLNASAAEANFLLSLANNYHILSLLSLQLISWARSAVMVAFYLWRMHFFVNFPTWDNENDFLFGREREKRFAESKQQKPTKAARDTRAFVVFAFGAPSIQITRNNETVPETTARNNNLCAQLSRGDQRDQANRQ